jgi:hypothetical protein
MKAYGSWASLVVIFLCAAAGSHIIADRISTHLTEKKCAVTVSPAPMPQPGKERLKPEATLHAAQGHDAFSRSHWQLCSVINSRKAQAMTSINVSAGDTSRFLSRLCECNVADAQAAKGKRS